jgi:ATP-dependent Clp protease ATP-binding subunit ClpA
MYERFTDRARTVMQLANQEAQRLNHEYIGTEHILLGLAYEGSGVAANVLKNLVVDLRKIRQEIEKIVQSGSGSPSGKLPQTPRAKKVIEYAIEEARNLNHNYVGTEHLLLGLLREEDGVASQVLRNLGLQLADVREEVLNLLGHDLGGKGSRPIVRQEEAVSEDTDFPEQVLLALGELDARLRQLAEAKEDAVARQDFEQAARLRDEADKLIKQREKLANTWRDKKILPLREYDLYIPLRSPDGSPTDPETLVRLRGRLVEQFGSVIEFRQQIEGAFKIGAVPLRGEVAVFRLLSPTPGQAVLFLTQLKEELWAELRLEDILILTRQVEVL